MTGTEGDGERQRHSETLEREAETGTEETVETEGVSERHRETV